MEGKTVAGKGRLAWIFGAKFEKSCNFYKFQFEIALNGYLDKFHKRSITDLDALRAANTNLANFVLH